MIKCIIIIIITIIIIVITIVTITWVELFEALHEEHAVEAANEQRAEYHGEYDALQTREEPQKDVEEKQEVAHDVEHTPESYKSMHLYVIYQIYFACTKCF